MDISSAYKGVAVTAADATVLPTTRSLLVGTGGDVAVVFAAGGSAVTLKNIASGTILPVQVTKVMSTNTTATDIGALY
jgi:hypothetical protein